MKFSKVLAVKLASKLYNSVNEECFFYFILASSMLHFIGGFQFLPKYLFRGFQYTHATAEIVRSFLCQTFDCIIVCVVFKNGLNLDIYYNEPVHEISNNVVGAPNKASDQPAHLRSLIKAFASRLSIL